MTMTTMEDLEFERHKAEVRYVISLRIKDRNEAIEYLKKVREKRKTNKLERDVIDQWSRGNRGEKGEWRD